MTPVDAAHAIIARQIRRVGHQATSLCTLRGCEGKAMCLHPDDDGAEDYADAALAELRAGGMLNEAMYTEAS